MIELYFPIREVVKGQPADLVWVIPPPDLQRWRDHYPGVDVEQEIRKACMWLHANPGRRKTARGMPRFLVNWLNKVKPVQQPARLQIRGGNCPHTPMCRRTSDCITRTITESREARGQV